jgi:hypothetical protein
VAIVRSIRKARIAAMPADYHSCCRKVVQP